MHTRSTSRVLFLGLIAASMVAVSACGDDDGGVDGGGGGTDGGMSTTDGGGGGTDGGMSTTDGGGGGVDGGAAGASCTSDIDPACTATEYCDFPDDLCGTGVPMGECRARPTTCEPAEESVCSCGNPTGLVYLSPCAALMGGKDLNNGGGCMPAAETYICGSHVCRTGMEYCVHSATDVGGTADSYSCVTLPAACTGMTACTCFPTDTPCVDMCAYADGNFTITCLGG